MNAPAFQFYAQDFLTGVMYLTNEEIGIYIKMLAKQWTDGKIPKKRLGFLVGCEWDNFSDELRSKFVDYGDYLLNERLEKEREKKSKFIKKQSENGKKGGRPKKIESSETIKNTQEKTQTKPNPLNKQNPNKTQKKPLEDEDRSMKTENENENEKGGLGEKTKKEQPKVELIYPFVSETFMNAWQYWKDYKRDEHKFKYKSERSEQAALLKLSNLSKGSEERAISIIRESIANGWKGFFEIDNRKTQKNGKQGFESIDERADAALRKFGFDV